MADEEYYLQVENEIKEGTKDVAIWSKAKVFAEENNTDPQHEYNKLRVEQLKSFDTKENVKAVVKVAAKGAGGIGIAVILFFAIVAFNFASEP
tara:strand:+ start:53 stop:331 length:279 start_codon:yes stop_codon:yes gene_type:complete